jgi:Flp pilus assembly protein TadD
MNQPLRTTTAVSLVILSSMIAGCATPSAEIGTATHFGGKADGDVGVATRALAALNSNNVPLAIDLAERAVAKNPNDAGFRALLGNAYFAGGRFHSAEAAYRDSLSVYSNQPQVVLKLALVEIALGKNAEAVSFLNAGRDVLDASDYGLALALAGRPSEAIAVLEPAARKDGADATVRQNLALAHALAGHWDEARTIAAQDVPANQLDARIQQWMHLAKPAHASDQVAQLVGVTPAVVDAGQPVQLALNKGETQLAEAAPAPAPAPKKVAKAPVKPAVAQAVAAQAAPAVAKAPAAKPAPVVAMAAVAPAPAVVAPAPVRAASVPPAPPPPRPTLATYAATAVTQAKAVFASVVPHSEAPAAKPVARPAKPAASKLRLASVPVQRRGNSTVVVQLGAFGSPDRVLTAWNGAARKYGVLKAYLPTSARFASAKGTFYRLSVRGFDSVGEAHTLCNSLRRQGGSCFVRNFAGDAPVQYASR